MQDTPSIRTTYSADVTVQSPYVAHMSAITTGSKVNKDNTITYSFTQAIPIPSYLLAFSVGNIQEKSLGKRTNVISEPTHIDDDEYELQDLGHLLDLGEEYMGTYIWGNYSIIVQPPSFPIGGMENPLLTFASPTIILGDRS